MAWGFRGGNQARAGGRLLFAFKVWLGHSDAYRGWGSPPSVILAQIMEDRVWMGEGGRLDGVEMG